MPPVLRILLLTLLQRLLLVGVVCLDLEGLTLTYCSRPRPLEPTPSFAWQPRLQGVALRAGWQACWRASLLSTEEGVDLVDLEDALVQTTLVLLVRPEQPLGFVHTEFFGGCSRSCFVVVQRLRHIDARPFACESAWRLSRG